MHGLGTFPRTKHIKEHCLTMRPQQTPAASPKLPQLNFYTFSLSSKSSTRVSFPGNLFLDHQSKLLLPCPCRPPRILRHPDSDSHCSSCEATCGNVCPLKVLPTSLSLSEMTTFLLKASNASTLHPLPIVNTARQGFCFLRISENHSFRSERS